MSRVTTAVSFTLNNQTKEVLDIILTPSGFLSPPKGSYSELINLLIIKYIEDIFQTNTLNLYELIKTDKEQGRTSSLEDLKERVQEAVNGNGFE